MNFHIRLALLLFAAITLAIAPRAGAQGGGGDTNINFGNPIAGVEVDATGVLRIKQFDPRLAQERLFAARKIKGADAVVPAKLRKVSLNRLEAAVAKMIAAGDQVDTEMLSMAGLTRIEYVFFYPETSDIVIAGPAEGVVADPAGRMVGIQSGKPVVMLEDMVTALRAFAPSQKPTSVISVSIDPTPEGLQRMQQFLASVRGNLRPDDAQQFTRFSLKENLGLQTVSIKGIPRSTNFGGFLWRPITG